MHNNYLYSYANILKLFSNNFFPLKAGLPQNLQKSEKKN